MLEIYQRYDRMASGLLSIWKSILMNEHIGKQWSGSMSVRLAYVVILLIALVLMFPGCENGNASKKSEAGDLIQEAPADERVAVQDDVLAEALSLTGEQREQVGRINSKYAGQVESILGSDDYRSRKVRRFKSAMAKKDRELKKVFSKEQYKMYEQIREELRQRLR